MRLFCYLVGLLLFPIFATANSNVKVPHHCNSSEKVIFTGVIEKNNKIVSVCEIDNKLQYRYGKQGNIDIMLPQNINNQTQIKTANRSNYQIGYSITYLRFINKDYNYVLTYGYGDDGTPFASLDVYKEMGSGGAMTSKALSNMKIKDNFYLSDDSFNIQQDRDDDDYTWF